MSRQDIFNNSLCLQKEKKNVKLYFDSQSLDQGFSKQQPRNKEIQTLTLNLLSWARLSF